MDFFDIDELKHHDKSKNIGQDDTKFLEFEDYRVQSNFVTIDYYYVCNITNLILFLINKILNDRKYDEIINGILSNNVFFNKKFIGEYDGIYELFQELNMTKLVKIKISKFEWDKEISIHRILLFLIFFDCIFEFTFEIELDFSVEKIDKYFNKYSSFLQTKLSLIQKGAEAYDKALIANSIISNKFLTPNDKFQYFKIIAFDSYMFENIMIKNEKLKNSKSGINYLNYIDNMEKLIKNLQFFEIEFNSFDKTIFKCLNHLFLYNEQISYLSINFFPKSINKNNFYKTCLNNNAEKNLFGILTNIKDKNIIIQYDKDKNESNEILDTFTSIYNKINSNPTFSFENFDANLFLEKTYQQYSEKIKNLKNIDMSNEGIICESVFEDFSENLKNFLIILEKRLCRLKYLKLRFGNTEFINSNDKFNCLIGSFIYSIFSIFKKYENEIDMIKFDLHIGNLRFEFLGNNKDFPIIDLSRVKIIDFSIAGEIREFFTKIIFPMKNVKILKLSKIDMKYVNNFSNLYIRNKEDIGKNMKFEFNFGKLDTDFRKIRKLCLEFDIDKEEINSKINLFNVLDKELNLIIDNQKSDCNNEIILKRPFNKKFLEKILIFESSNKELFKFYFIYFDKLYGKFYFDNTINSKNIEKNDFEENESKLNKIKNKFSKICEVESLQDFFYNLKIFEKYAKNNIFFDYEKLEFTKFYDVFKHYLTVNKDYAQDFQIFVLILNIIDCYGYNLIFLLQLIYLYDYKKSQYRIKLRYLNLESFSILSKDQNFYLISEENKAKKTICLRMYQRIISNNYKMVLFLIENFKLKNYNSGKILNKNAKNRISQIIKNVKRFLQEDYNRIIEVNY